MVPALEPVFIFALVMVCAVLIALSYAYRATFGALLVELVKLGSVSVGIPHVGSIHPLRPLAAAAGTIDNAIRHGFGVGIANSEWALNRAIQWFAYSVQWIGRGIAELAEDVDRAFQVTLAHYIPHAVTTVTRTIVKPVEHVVTRTRVVTHALAAGAMARVAALEKHVKQLQHAAALAVAGAVAIPFPRIGRIERESAASRKWIARHAGVLTVAGISALVVAALGRLGLGWTRCTNVRNVGKGVCGINPSLLESLLADTLLIAGTVSLAEFARGMQGITEEITPAIRAFWRAT